MDRSKFEQAQELSEKINACNHLLQVPKQNSLHVEVHSLYTIHAVIPADLWEKIIKTVKQAKQQYDEELNAL